MRTVVSSGLRLSLSCPKATKCRPFDLAQTQYGTLSDNVAKYHDANPVREVNRDTPADDLET